MVRHTGLYAHRKVFAILAALPLGLLGACGAGGTSGTGVSSSALSEVASEVPVAGQFLADCTEDGLALIRDFEGALPVPEPPAEVPAIGDVLALGDPDAIPVIGGLEPPALPEGDLAPTDLDSALSMLPLTGVPAGLPVVGLVPVTCDDVPLPLDELPEPTDALGLIPVFDAGGDPVALVLAVVGQPSPGTPDVTDVALPDPDALLPEPLGGAVGTLVSALDLLPL